MVERLEAHDSNSSETEVVTLLQISVHHMSLFLRSLPHGGGQARTAPGGQRTAEHIHVHHKGEVEAREASNDH